MSVKGDFAKHLNRIMEFLRDQRHPDGDVTSTDAGKLEDETSRCVFHALNNLF